MTMAMTSAGTFPRPGNNLLRRLREPDYALVRDVLSEVSLDTGALLYRSGANVEYAYFPEGASLAAFVVSNADGRDVETILVGREGAVGGIVSAGHLPAYCCVNVKHGGKFLRLRLTALEAAKSKSLTLRAFFARYADCLLAQAFQSTACNAIHTIEQRAAKWILAAKERTEDDLVPLTHEQLSTMLGVGRSYTSRVIQVFKAERILETRRGALLVKDPESLRRRACDCNEAVKAHFETVLQGVYPAPDDLPAE